MSPRTMTQLNQMLLKTKWAVFRLKLLGRFYRFTLWMDHSFRDFIYPEFRENG
jgi:hypothetical protein